MTKHLLIAILSIPFLFISMNAQAQSTVKEMDKKTKAELKEYMKDPSAYRKMIKNYKDQIESTELQLSELQEDYYKADYLRKLYYDSIQELNHIIAGLNAQPVVEKSSSTGSSMYSNKGTDYRVQIGAYRYFDFTQLLQFNQPIGFEKIDGIIYYYLGSWSNANEAYDFAKAIRKLKIDDAFVSKYVNGQRVPYDHLIEGGGTAYAE